MEYRTIEYKNYIIDHINEVKRQYEKYKPVFVKMFPEVYADQENMIEYLIESHDQSKFSKAEFVPYLDRFFPAPGKSKNSDYEFNRGWLNHIHNNPHHPQYWVLHDNGQKFVYDMPDEYIIEMICDWLAMGAKKNNKIWDYWETDGKEKDYSPATEVKVVRLIYTIKRYDEENPL